MLKLDSGSFAATAAAEFQLGGPVRQTRQKTTLSKFHQTFASFDSSGMSNDTPQVILVKQTSLRVIDEPVHEAGGDQTRPVHVVIKQQPFSLHLASPKGFPIKHCESLKLKLWYSDAQKTVDFISKEPVTFKRKGLKQGPATELILEVKIGVLSSQLEDSCFRIEVMLDEHRSTGIFTEPYRVISKPEVLENMTKNPKKYLKTGNNNKKQRSASGAAFAVAAMPIATPRMVNEFGNASINRKRKLDDFDSPPSSSSVSPPRNSGASDEPMPEEELDNFNTGVNNDNEDDEDDVEDAEYAPAAAVSSRSRPNQSGITVDQTLSVAISQANARLEEVMATTERVRQSLEQVERQHDEQQRQQPTQQQQQLKEQQKADAAKLCCDDDDMIVGLLPNAAFLASFVRFFDMYKVLDFDDRVQWLRRLIKAPSQQRDSFTDVLAQFCTNESVEQMNANFDANVAIEPGAPPSNHPRRQRNVSEGRLPNAQQQQQQQQQGSTSSLASSSNNNGSDHNQHLNGASINNNAAQANFPPPHQPPQDPSRAQECHCVDCPWKRDLDVIVSINGLV